MPCHTNRVDMVQSSETKIAVLGLGYVGCVTAACLAQIGHRVVGIDRDEFKVQSVLDGRAPFFEPDLDELVQQNVARGRLSAAVSVAQGLQDADIALICVGTPSERNGNLGLEQLRRVSVDISQELPDRSKPLIVVVRSTVFPGTCEEIVMQSLGHHPGAMVVCNPEFLREGTAVRDFMQPSLLVVGGHEACAVKKVAGLYSALPVEPCLVSLRTAEMIKYACNCFHALKVGFANEIGTICSRLNIPGSEVMDTLCRDVKLNISPAYLKPGFAFGGSCLPKDLRALVYRAGQLDLDLPLLKSVLPSNEQHLRRAIEATLELPAERIGVFGLAFKENTDDLRESPTVTLIEQLLAKGREVHVFDPHIQIEQIFGSNKRFILAAVPHISRLLHADLEEFLGWTQHLVMAQKPPAKVAEQIRQRGLPVLDLLNL